MADPVGDAVKACARLRTARQKGSEAVVAKEAALVKVWESGVAKARVGEVVREALAGAGWTAADIQKVGLSDASVALALRGR